MFHSHVLQFCKRHFCPFKIATQGVSLWHFHLFVYYSLIWFISSIFLLSTLILFLWWFWLVLKVYIHSCIESTSTIFTFLASFFYSALRIYDLPLVWPVLHNIAVFILGFYFTNERKHVAFHLLNRLTSLKMMFSSSIHLQAEFFMYLCISGLKKLSHNFRVGVNTVSSHCFPMLLGKNTLDEYYLLHPLLGVLSM
jgi:hypothetical protein